MVVSAFLMLTNVALGQKASLAKAEKEYETFAYIDAIKTYEKVAEKGYKDAAMCFRIANSYYFNAEYKSAYKWYAEYKKLEANPSKDFYYRYAMTLKSVGEYDQSDLMMKEFVKLKGDDYRAVLFKGEPNYLDLIKKNSGRYLIEPLNVNSELTDFGTSFFGEEMIFSSSRENKQRKQKIQKWNNQAFLSLYSSRVDSQGNFQEPEPFFKDMDSDYNESTPTFTRDMQTVYFTRNNIVKNKRIKDKDNTTLLKIYKATINRQTKQVTDIKELPFNSDQYSCAHPMLTVNEKYLYFASDMPGSIGMSDIYRVKILGNDTYGEPENLGPKLNTEGRETYPFVSQENELYFSSDGHPGLGGLDVFVAKFDNHVLVSDIKNVGEPVNSKFDDFAFYMDTQSKMGFVSSNREGGQGFDDIYKLKELKPIDCKQLLKGRVTDKDNNQPLADTKVRLHDKDNKFLKEVTTNANGEYAIPDLDCEAYYVIRFDKTEYETVEDGLITKKDNGETIFDIKMARVFKKVTTGEDLAKLFKISNIYFDLDKSEITERAKKDLFKILTVLEDHPTMSIDINAHTDSRASDQYNLKLSERRAVATKKWFESQGISSSRLNAKGFGESKLINNCSNGVQCSEEEHQLNRRSEFIISKI